MGQSISNSVRQSLQKVHIEIQKDVSLVKKELSLARDIAFIDHESLKESVSNLNMILKSCCQSSPELVLFGLEKIDPEDVFWKTDIKIICFRIKVADRSVQVARLMNLPQFWRLRDELIQEIKYKRMLDEYTTGFEFVDEELSGSENEDSSISQDQIREEPLDSECTLTVSNVLQRVEHCTGENDVNRLEECSICMDNRCNISLPCAHSFCEVCISQWSIENHTCPVCRHKIDAKKEFWEFTEIPNTEELNKQLLAMATGDT